jgi:uncharacterized protein YhbP (UPF0306 family)
LTLIQSESTLTLATAGPSGPWSAPVYYVWVDDRFCFFSSPESRHIRQAIAAGKAAASLFHQADTWQDLRGIQLVGTVQRVQSVSLSLKAVATYLNRFPFTLDFFPGNAAPDANAFFSRFKARLYALTPTNMFYTDNRFGFAARQQIHWTDR